MSSALSVGYRLCRILATRVLTYAVFLFIAIGNPFSALLLATPGDLYVSESSRVIDSDLIQHFHPNGAKEDNLASDLNFARGLVFDSLGNLFAVDLRSGSIRKFDRAGARIAFISGEGAYNLMGLAFDNAGNLFVSKFISEIGSISVTV